MAQHDDTQTDAAMAMAGLCADVLESWYGLDLPAESQPRAGAEITALAAAFRALTPPPFHCQAHDFTPLLLALADRLDDDAP